MHKRKKFKIEYKIVFEGTSITIGDRELEVEALEHIVKVCMDVVKTTYSNIDFKICKKVYKNNG
jgi:hypothetical protein